jgi:molybdopterin biosynthesis enzyme
LGAALAALDHLKYSPMIRHLQAKKEVLDTADPQQVPTLEADQSVLASDVVARVPSTR